MGYSDCLEVEEKHFCARCPEDFETEFAGARASGYIKKSYYPTLIASPLTLSVWEAGIASGDIIVIPETRGTFDPGEPKEGKGYGDRKISYGARTMVLALFEKFDKDNLAFWDTIHLRTDLIPFFRTSSLLHIFKTVAVIKAGYSVSEDVEEVLEWAFTATVTGSLPSLHKYETIASVFECPASTAPGALSITTQPTNKTGAEGDNITFSIVASGGTAPRKFQLQKDVNGSWTNVGSVTNTPPVITGATAANNGSYRIIVSDSASPAATITSSTVTLTITDATTYDSVFTFANNKQGDGTPQDDGGSGKTYVGMNAGGTSNTKKLEFNRKPGVPTGPGTIMTIKVGGQTEMVVSYAGNPTPAGYTGDPLRYTDEAGVVHTKFANDQPAVFTAGIVNF